MEWQIIVALVVAVPIILFPVAFVWYINLGGVISMLKRAREKRFIQKRDTVEQETEYKQALVEALKRFPWNKELKVTR